MIDTLNRLEDVPAADTFTVDETLIVLIILIIVFCVSYDIIGFINNNISES